MSQADILATLTLTGREWRAVGELGKAKLAFEPLAMRAGVGPIVLERLIGLGIAEIGPSDPRFNREMFPTGCRLTPLGRRILARGRRPLPAGEEPPVPTPPAVRKPRAQTAARKAAQ